MDSPQGGAPCHPVDLTQSYHSGPRGAALDASTGDRLGRLAVAGLLIIPPAQSVADRATRALRPWGPCGSPREVDGMAGKPTTNAT
ncbi:hypothetical protein JOF56_009683 [Kibdelosporangium banguiense]|uniref:Uncharacterized protein n=1 Tax=Kibdelosporangium banguiense TaxID=1365924 RepID=A0ABS4TY24_9PSEU|nr:hypothetical protein [Kibdelosporangium banguiense]